MEDSFYYAKTTEIDEAAIVEAQCGDLLVDIPEMVVEILEPVPSYEELQNIKSKYQDVVDRLKGAVNELTFIQKILKIKDDVEKMESLERAVKKYEKDVE